MRAGDDDRRFFLPGMVFEAESAADVLGDHADRGLRQAQRQRDVQRATVRALAGDVESQLLRSLSETTIAARFHRRL